MDSGGASLGDGVVERCKVSRSQAATRRWVAASLAWLGLAEAVRLDGLGFGRATRTGGGDDRVWAVMASSMLRQKP